MRYSRWIYIHLGVLSIFVVDRLCKGYLVSGGDMSAGSVAGIRFALTYNSGISWGIPITGLWAMLISGGVLLGACILIAACYTRKAYLVGAAALGIAAGGFSNLLDRIRYDAVIDYIHVSRFSVLNIADLMISLGTILLIGALVFRRRHLL